MEVFEPEVEAAREDLMEQVEESKQERQPYPCEALALAHIWRGQVEGKPLTDIRLEMALKYDFRPMQIQKAIGSLIQMYLVGKSYESIDGHKAFYYYVPEESREFAERIIRTIKMPKKKLDRVKEKRKITDFDGEEIRRDKK
jgi:predicted transcriptional regulator